MTAPTYQTFLTSEIKRQYLTFQERWSSCTYCNLYLNSSHYVFFRGTLPADLLLIGEAPGTTENIIGYPFIGQSGKLLDQLITESISYYRTHYTDNYTSPIHYAITNTVSCIPLTDYKSIRPPSPLEIKACSPRLLEFTDLVSPKAIVAIGNVANKLLRNHPILRNREFLHVHHPAYLLRKGARKDTTLLYKKWILEFSELLTRAYPKS